MRKNQSKNIKKRNPYRSNIDLDELNFKIGYLYALSGELKFRKIYPISEKLFKFGRVRSPENKFMEGYSIGWEDSRIQFDLISKNQIDEYISSLNLELKELIQTRKIYFPNADDLLLNGQPIDKFINRR